MAESIATIKNKLQAASYEELPLFMEQYKDDSRNGVVALVAKAQKQMDAYEKELQRTENMKKFEKQYADYEYICGIDEVGRGPLVGNVVAACVVLPLNYQLEGLTDSKKLSEKKREKFYEIIKKDALAIGVGEVDEKEIDRDAMNHLVNYYINFLRWDEIKSLNYAIGLFQNGTIDEILGLR